MSTGNGDDNVEIVGGVDPRAMATQTDEDSEDQSLTDLVEQPAKVMRIGTMIKQLLEEVRAAPLDEASRNRLREIHATSIRELEDGLAPELREELDRLTLPFNEAPPRRTPSCASPRRSWSGGWKGCFTASKPRCSPSRWRPARSSSRCARARCRRVSTGTAATDNRAPDNTCKQHRCLDLASRRATRGWSFPSSMPSRGR
ncbi:hypothetical protein I552_3510 [Mycobacterium xenopi 3993]|nr:hypothetical protein I552_3510 [Mycobacterium xenopi 3993]